MEKKRKRGCRIAGLFAAAVSIIFFIGMLAGRTAEAGEGSRVSILFTHDMHSHINSFRTVYKGEDVDIGGFGRIQTIINRQRAKDPETLLVDGGDFSMGSLFQTVYETQASEIRLMGAMGYDATTFGNHEFDFRSKGLENMLRTAAESGESLPSLLVCNVDWTDAGKEQEGIKEAFDVYGVKEYEIVEKNGVRIALIGVFGEDALACAPTCALSFQNPAEAVAETVEEILAKEEVDMLVCLSHCGTNEDKRKSEDEKKKKGILLIVDGTEPDLVRSILETELSCVESRHKAVIGFWEDMASMGPAWGMIGTLIGLVNMLKNLEDASTIGPNMAVALLTTLYGSLIANWVATPIANKMKYNTDMEVQLKEVTIEGLLSIQAGENPRVIEEKLKSFIAPKERAALGQEEGGGE